MASEKFSSYEKDIIVKYVRIKHTVRFRNGTQAGDARAILRNIPDGVKLEGWSDDSGDYIELIFVEDNPQQ